MKVFDIDGNLITAEEIDYSTGRVIEEQMLIAHHPAKTYIKEIGHYETIKEYPNGGKDVKWVVDVPGQRASEAWDEYETVLRVIPFTEKEKAQNEIDELKEKLIDTDYNIIKIVEGVATREEMTNVIAQRAEWRRRINELEAKFNI